MIITKGEMQSTFLIKVRSFLLLNFLVKIGNINFKTGHQSYIVGILNATPDSFSDGGKYVITKAAVKKAKEMQTEGVDIIDLGGESTRPGYSQVSKAEELKRVLPILKALKKEINVPISVDTQKATVALEAAKFGADMINNCGIIKDINIVQICKKYNIAYCVVHNRKNAFYKNLIKECLNDLSHDIENAKKAGLCDEKIIVDPGIGFAKNYEQNIEILKNLKSFKSLGYPVMLGASRKSFLGEILGLHINERDDITTAITAFAVVVGCDFIRVHNVKKNKDATKIINMIVRR